MLLAEVLERGEPSVAVICFEKSWMFEDGVMYAMYAIPTALFEWWVFDDGDDGTCEMGVRSCHIKATHSIRLDET